MRLQAITLAPRGLGRRCCEIWVGGNGWDKKVAVRSLFWAGRKTPRAGEYFLMYRRLVVERIGPLGWGESMDEAFALCRANFWPLFGLTAVGVSVLTPLGILLPWMLRWFGPAFIPEVSAGYLVQIAGYNLLVLWILQGIRALMAGEQIGWAKSFRQALSMFIPNLITGLLWFLILVLGFALLIVPGLFLVPVYSALAVPVMVFEGRFYLDALRRSYSLVVGAYWKIGTILFFYSVIGTSVVLAIFVPLFLGVVAVTQRANPFFVAVAAGIFGYAGQLLLPFTLCLLAVVYRERVAGREGDDLEISWSHLEEQI